MLLTAAVKKLQLLIEHTIRIMQHNSGFICHSCSVHLATISIAGIVALSSKFNMMTGLDKVFVTAGCQHHTVIVN